MPTTAITSLSLFLLPSTVELFVVPIDVPVASLMQALEEAGEEEQEKEEEEKGRHLDLKRTRESNSVAFWVFFSPWWT